MDPPPTTAASSTPTASASTASAGTAAPVAATASAVIDGFGLSLDLVVPAIESTTTAAGFFEAVGLPTGTIVAAGPAIDPATGSGDAAGLWRSVDGGASFQQVGADVASPEQIEHVVALAEHGGTAYAFVLAETMRGQVSVWSSSDDGATWNAEPIGEGIPTWGGTVDGVPTVAVQIVDGSGGALSIRQRRDGAWGAAQLPPTGPGALVRSIATLPGGTVLAVGARCDTDPGAVPDPGACSVDRPDAPVDSLALVSRDGGATWANESEWLGGAPGAQFASAITVVGAEAIIGITGSTLQGDAFFPVLNSTTDGPSWGGFGTMPVWNGGSTPVLIEAIAPAGGAIVALIRSERQGDTPAGTFLLVHDRTTGAQDLIDLEERLALSGGYGLIDVRGTPYIVGSAEVGDTVAAALIAVRPAA